MCLVNIFYLPPWEAKEAKVFKYSAEDEQRPTLVYAPATAVQPVFHPFSQFSLQLKLYSQL